MDVARLAEADLVLGRMHVDVHHPGLDPQIQHERRIARARERVAEPDPDRMPHDVVAYAASVHEEELEVGAGARGLRRGQESAHRQAARLEGDLQRPLRELLPQQARETARALHAPGRLEHLAGVVVERERDVGTGEGEPAHRVLDVPELGAGGAQELAPGRNVVEQVPHLHRGPGLQRRGLHRPARPALDAHPRAARCFPRPALQGEPRHRGDARQGLSAKPHAGDAVEVLQGRDLAGRVAGKRERQLAGGDAEPVVAHPDQARPARLELDGDLPRARVEGVLHQLLDDGRGALHDLPRRDLVHQHPGQGPDRGRGRGLARGFVRGPARGSVHCAAPSPVPGRRAGAAGARDDSQARRNSARWSCPLSLSPPRTTSHSRSQASRESRPRISS